MALKIPSSLDSIHGLYPDFGTRLAAFLLDILFVVPLMVLSLIANLQGLEFYYYTLAFNFIFGLWYYIYLPKRYGGTPGKLVMNIKIIRLDGGHIDWKEAFWRHSVSMAIAILSGATTIYALGQADPAVYESMGWMGQSQYLVSAAPIANKLVSWIGFAWILAGLIVLLTNDRKRAVHDMIAKTVVIKKLYHDKVKELTGNPGGDQPQPVEIPA